MTKTEEERRVVASEWSLQRRRVLRALGGLAALPALGPQALFAQAAWPSRLVRVVVGVEPGGPSDLVTRAVTRQMAAATGQGFVVENRGGAGGAIGMQAVAASPADGYTLAWGAFSAIILRPALNVSAAQFESEKVLVPVSIMADQASVLTIHGGMKATNLRELIAELKANPGKYNYGSPGVGHIAHLLGELFARQAGVQITHVPYNGDRANFQGLVRGDVHLSFTAPNLYSALLDKVRLIAAAAPRRVSAYPNVPTLAEEGIEGLGYTAWHALFAPIGTPRPVIERIDREVKASLTVAEVRGTIENMGLSPSPLPTDEFAARVARERTEWRRIARELNIKA